MHLWIILKISPLKSKKTMCLYKECAPKFPNKETCFNQNICWQLVSADSKVEKKISIIVDFCFVYKRWICKLGQNGDSLSVFTLGVILSTRRYIYTDTHPEYTYISTNHAHHLFRTGKTHACFYNIKWKADGRPWSTEISEILLNPTPSNIPSNFSLERYQTVLHYSWFATSKLQ